MITFPNAKINIGLHVQGKRSDGYHNIETVMYPLKGILYDVLEIVRSSNFKFSAKGGPASGGQVSGLGIKGDKKNNLCVKAYHLLAKDFSLPLVKIYLYKNIPVGAGLGGGSSDGACMLKLLNEKFGLNLSEDKLMDYAGKLGSDCPFFIRNEPAVVRGRGEKISPCKINLNNYRIEVIFPDISVSTAEAYKEIDKLKVRSQKSKIKLNELVQLPIEKWKANITNDFEKVIFPKYPAIKKLKDRFYARGALYASMSGSGSAVFGVFPKKGSQRDYTKAIQNYEHSNPPAERAGIRTFE